MTMQDKAEPQAKAALMTHLLRRVSRQGRGDAIYSVPDTGRWAGWRDADAVVYHGTRIAARVNGRWLDSDGDPVSRETASRYSRMHSVGIATGGAS